MENKRKKAEDPVRGWELEATNKQVEVHERLISGIDNKLDTIINLMNTRPTNDQVEDKIKATKLEFERQLANAIEKQDLKYSPIVGNNKWLLGLLLASGLGLFGSLIFIAIGVTR